MRMTKASGKHACLGCPASGNSQQADCQYRCAPPRQVDVHAGHDLWTVVYASGLRTEEGCTPAFIAMIIPAASM